jgi:hypothetical protein
MYKHVKISMYISNDVETSHHLISIRLYFILTILITEDGSQPYFYLDCSSAGFFFITFNKFKKYASHCRNRSSIQ